MDTALSIPVIPESSEFVAAVVEHSIYYKMKGEVKYNISSGVKRCLTRTPTLRLESRVSSYYL